METIVATRDAALRRELVDLVEALGHQATEAADSAELLKLGLRGDADLVVLDLYLGPLEGVELIDLLKAMAHEMLLVPLVGDNDDELEFAVRSQGIFYYMLAPVTSEELSAVLESAARRIAR